MIINVYMYNKDGTDEIGINIQGVPKCMNYILKHPVYANRL